MCGELAEEGDGLEARGIEGVVDVGGEIGADGFGWEGKAVGPLPDEVFDVLEAVVAGELKVLGELGGGEIAEEVGAAGPDGGDPGEACAGVPLVGEVEVLARAFQGEVDGGVLLEGEEGGVADEEGGVGLGEHGDGVGGGGEEGGVGAEEVAKEDLCVGDGGAGGGVGGDGSNGFEGVAGSEEEKDGADAVERRDRTAGDDGEVGGEGGDGDETEGSAAGDEILGTLSGGGVVEGVTGG